MSVVTLPAYFAALPPRPSISEVLEFQATGLIVVFGALAVLWALLELMGAFFRRRPAAAAVPAPSTPTTAPKVEDGVEPAVVAVIAAAVHVALKGQPHQITEIKASENTPNWAAEGRREHFSSHRVR